MVSFSQQRKDKAASEKTAAVASKQESANEFRDTSNKRFEKQRDDFDEKHNTQAGIAKRTGSGKFVESGTGKQKTLTPVKEQVQLQSVPNEHGGQDYTSYQRENLHFGDSVQVERAQYIANERSQNVNQRAKIVSRQTAHEQFLQSGQPDALAIIEYFNQYKSSARPSKAAIQGYLEERDIRLSKEGDEFLRFVTTDKGSLSSFGTSTYYDPKSKTMFNAKTGEGDRKLAERLGFRVTPQSPSLPAGNNQPVAQSKPQDVQALEQFFSQYKSTSRPPKTALVGYLQERNIPISQEGEAIINDVTRNKNPYSVERTSTYTDPQTNTQFNAKTGEGDRKLAERIGLVPKQKPTPDPLGVSKGTENTLASLETKSLQSKEILDSDANFRTKGKAAIEQVESEVGKYFVGIGGNLINLGGSIASQPVVSLKVGKIVRNEKPYQEQVQVPKTYEDYVIENSFKSGDIPKSFDVARQQYTEKYGTIGFIGSLGATGLAIYGVKGVNPIKYSKYVIPTAEKEGALIASRQLALQYGDKALIIGGKINKGKYFIGKPKPENIPYREKYDIGASRGVEPSSFSPVQRKIYESHKPYLIENKLVNPNVKTADIVERNVKAQTNISYTYKNELPKDYLGSDISPSNTEIITKAINKQQNKKLIQGAKGGIVESSIKEKPSKVTQEELTIQRNLQSQGYTPQETKDIGSFPVKQFPVKDVDLEEIKIGRGIQAAQNIEKIPLEEGLKFERSGANVNVNTGKEVKPLINIVKIKEDPNEAASLSQFGSGKVFGSDYPTDSFKISLEGSKAKLSFHGMEHQVHGLAASTTALQSEKTLRQAGKSQLEIDKILGGYRTTQYPFAAREKDIVGMHASLLKTAKLQLKSGQKAKAIQTYKGALEYKKTYENLFDWKTEVKKFKKSERTLSITSSKQPKSNSYLSYGTKSAKSYGSYGSIGSKASSVALSPKSTKSALSQKSTKSPKSVKSQLSVRSLSSLGSSKSTKSAKSSKSAKSIGSVGSIKSLYGKSSYGGKSAKSVYASSKGTYGKGTSGKSVFGLGKSIAPSKILLPVLLKAGLPNKRSYPKIEKPTQTFRHGVKNPFSSAFSISEGKRGKRIEPF